MKHLFSILFVFLGFQGNYKRMHATNMLSTMLQPFSSNIIEGGAGSTGDEKKLLEKIKEQNTKTINDVNSQFNEKLELAQKGKLSNEDFESFKKETQESLDGLKLTSDFKDSINQKHAELLDLLEKQGEKINRFKIKGESDNAEKEFATMSRKKQFQFLMEKAMDSDEYKAWEHTNMKGATQRMNAKAVIGLADDHTGDIFVTEPSDNVRDVPRMQAHMRDFLSVAPTDETNITFPEVDNYTDIYTLGAQMLSENDEITDVTFDSKENQSSVKRMGVSMSVSRRYFRGRSRVIIDHVIAQLPDALAFKEDVQILHGNGEGVNLDGVLQDAREFDLTPEAYVATNFSSVESYKGGEKTLVTFDVAHGLLSGDTLTIANATETTYNADHQEIILIDEKSVIINLAYVAEADTSSWTGAGSSYWYHSVESAQEFDVISAAQSRLEAGLYNANIAFMNPQTIKRIGTLKSDDFDYIGVSRDASGRLNIDGMPIVSMPVIPAGWYLIGDFTRKNIEIRDYTTMTIQFLEDLTTKRTNSIVILADEELHLIKYNPKWYIYDRFSTGISQLETPA